VAKYLKGALIYGAACIVLILLAIAIGNFERPESRLADGLHLVATSSRHDKERIVTAYYGHRYVQCRRASEETLSCETSGDRMQPALNHILSRSRLDQFAQAGWRQDPNFGNWVQTFPADTRSSDLAGWMLRFMAVEFLADPSKVHVRTAWIARQACPPRRDLSRRLPGAIDDGYDEDGGAGLIHACTYSVPVLEPRTAIVPVDDLMEFDGARIAREIDWLKQNGDDSAVAVFDTGEGYARCESGSDGGGIYCELSSVETLPVLAKRLTPDRIEQLHRNGFVRTGDRLNYGKTYPADGTPASAIAAELVTLLHDAYAYGGQPHFTVATDPVH
jgi:hypothetical protein